MKNLSVKKRIKTITFTSETEFQLSDLEQAAMKDNNNKIINKKNICSRILLNF